MYNCTCTHRYAMYRHSMWISFYFQLKFKLIRSMYLSQQSIENFLWNFRFMKPISNHLKKSNETNETGPNNDLKLIAIFFVCLLNSRLDQCINYFFYFCLFLLCFRTDTFFYRNISIYPLNCIQIYILKSSTLNNLQTYWDCKF